MKVNFLFSLALAQNQWQRRFYTSDNKCQSAVTLAVGVYLPGQCASTEFACEAKNTQSLASGESTGCENVNSFSPAPFNSSHAKMMDDVNYLVLNQFNTEDCSFKTSFEQNIFLADGACHAVETEKSFFKATCSDSSAQLDICSDSSCTECGVSLNAGTAFGSSLILNSTCSNGIGMVCSSKSKALSGDRLPTASQTGNPKTNGALSYRHIVTNLMGILVFVAF